MNNNIDWSKANGLVPAVVQNIDDGQILMLGYMNEESFNITQATKKVTFYSRSRKKLWIKGETSGNTLSFIDYRVDCDKDALLVYARPEGPTCHEGVQSCFEKDEKRSFGFLDQLDKLIEGRKYNLDEGSYTAKLFKAGIHRMAQKVGEEGVEVALAAKDNDLGDFLEEASDLLYHLMVLTQGKGLAFSDIVETLSNRHKKLKR